MTKEQAIAIAKTLVHEQRLVVGAFCAAHYISVEDYQREVQRVKREHGTWLISFAYAGPPVKEDPNVVRDPPLGGPTTITINDATGAAERMMEM